MSGTQEELKARFGTGFTVQLTLANPSHDTNLSGFDVEVFLKDNVHRGAGVKTQTGRVCSCHIPADADLAKLFRALCEADQGGQSPRAGGLSPPVCSVLRSFALGQAVRTCNRLSGRAILLVPRPAWCWWAVLRSGWAHLDRLNACSTMHDAPI